MKKTHKTIVQLHTLNEKERVKQQEYYRQKRLHDEASALGGAREEGCAEGFAEGKTERDNELIERWGK